MATHLVTTSEVWIVTVQYIVETADDDPSDEEILAAVDSASSCNHDYEETLKLELLGHEPTIVVDNWGDYIDAIMAQRRTSDDNDL